MAVCGKTTKKGEPCQNAPVGGKPYCIGHLDPADKAALNFGGPQPGAGGQRKPRPTEIARRLVEDHVQVVLAPHFRTLGYDVVRDDESGELAIVKLDGGGAKMHGESRDGDIVASSYEDLGAQIAAAEKLLDRIYGKPKQSQDVHHSGAVRSESVEIPDDDERKAEVARILDQAGALEP